MLRGYNGDATLAQQAAPLQRRRGVRVIDAPLAETRRTQLFRRGGASGA
jgi:hypothetical protein